MTITEMKKRNYGFIVNREQLYEIIKQNRLEPILVRCGACRFTTPAQDVEHICRAIESAGDYVRDLSFPASSY